MPTKKKSPAPPPAPAKRVRASRAKQHQPFDPAKELKSRLSSLFGTDMDIDVKVFRVPMPTDEQMSQMMAEATKEGHLFAQRSDKQGPSLPQVTSLSDTSNTLNNISGVIVDKLNYLRSRLLNIPGPPVEAATSNQAISSPSVVTSLAETQRNLEHAEALIGELLANS